jgi:peptidoglycan hydrolase-like protein with peptidoglycan-binding domain
MAQTIFIRSPFESVTGTTTQDYRISSDFGDIQATTVQINGTNPALLKLQPVFPGELTFKPYSSATIPADPSRPGSAPITGNLYLRLSFKGQKELGKVASSFNYGLLFVYLGVTLDSTFFNGTVLRALSKGSAYKEVSVNNTELKTAAQLSNYFAQGLLDITLQPTKSFPVYSFPTIIADPTTKRGTITLALGVLNTDDPYEQRPKAISLLEADEIMAAPDFVPFPLGYFYRMLSTDPDWSGLAADNNLIHTFYDSLGESSTDTPPKHWRRLRIFLPGPRSATPTVVERNDEMFLQASTGTNPDLWHSDVNRLGEIFVQREDDEKFTLTLSNNDGLIPISTSANEPGEKSLNLEWPAPEPSGELPEIVLTAYLLLTGDPLSMKVPLSQGAYDYKGRTIIISAGKPRILAQRELVRPLQDLLRGFGFGVTKELSGVFDVATRHAVREFQREASMTERTGANNQPIKAPSVTFKGAINGVADTATLDEMIVWRKNSYRARTSFYIVKDKQQTDDVGYSSSDIVEAEICIRDSTLSVAVRLGESTIKDSRMLGISNTKGHALSAVLTDAALKSRFGGETWKKRAICEVAFNEGQGVLEALNTWDDSFLSAGLFQWNLGRVAGDSELPAVCSNLKAEYFARFFGKWGLETTPVKGSVPRAQFKLDGVVLSQDIKREFRSFRWAYRFFVACQDPEFWVVQYNHAHSRLDVVLTTTLYFGGNKIVASQLLQSEFLRAVALDQHVNRPSHTRMPRSLQACINALLNPQLIISTTNKTGTWYEPSEMNFLKAEAVRIHKEGATVASLTATERANAEQKLATQLTELQQMCVTAGTSALKVVGNNPIAMSDAQVNALAALYKWRREYIEEMTAPKGRWENISAGGHTGTLGPLDKTAMHFAP